jgi:Protein of unknown function (DUF3311)
MSQPPPEAGVRRPLVTPARVVVALCLVVQVVALLWVSSYSRLTPTFIGIPFFYWYQLLWVIVSTALTAIAYLLFRREQAQRKDGAR